MTCSRSPHPSAVARRSPVRSAPIRCAAEALDLINLAITFPPRHETLGFLLDDAGYGSTIVVVSDTVPPDAFLDVAELLASASSGDLALSTMVLASVRPGGAVLPGDDRRWMEASEIADSNGIELLEWYVLDGLGSVGCPRDMFGEPPRWR